MCGRDLRPQELILFGIFSGFFFGTVILGHTTFLPSLTFQVLNFEREEKLGKTPNKINHLKKIGNRKKKINDTRLLIKRQSKLKIKF